MLINSQINVFLAISTTAKMISFSAMPVLANLLKNNIAAFRSRETEDACEPPLYRAPHHPAAHIPGTGSLYICSF